MIDRATNVILSSHKSNEVAKYISSTLLDTYTRQLSDNFFTGIENTLFVGEMWATIDKKWKIVKLDNCVSELNIEKRMLAYLRTSGYAFLLEQASILGTSYDSMGALDSSNLPIYLADKERYETEYSIAMNISLPIATKHLNFLADSLQSIYFRQQSLLWKYSHTLRSVNNSQQLAVWKEEVFKETIGLGQV